MYLWSCTCRRAGTLSASIHSESVLGSSTPCTGENRTAAHRPARPWRRTTSTANSKSRAILDDELHFVVRRQRVEIAPVVLVGLAARRALDVDDLDHFVWNAPDRPVPAGFEQHGPAAVDETPHQRVDIVLQQRFAAGDLDELATVALDVGDHLVQRPLRPFVKRVRRVAPRAAEVARRQADEHARLPRPGRLALNRVEDLVDRQHEPRISTILSCRPRSASAYGNRDVGPAHRHRRLELPERPRYVERRLLPRAARASEGVRRALVLRGALRHGRGELDFLRPAALRGDERLGRSHPRRLRVRREAVSEVHAPAYVQGARREIAARRLARRG